MTSESSDSSTGTSLTLLQQAASSVPGSWERLLKLYGPLVKFWGRKAGLQETDAADVAQDVFRVLSGRLAEFDPEKGEGFRAWLSGITRNTLRAHLRKQQSRPEARGGTSAQVMVRNLSGELDDATWTSISQSGIEQLLHSALELVKGDTKPHVWQAFWGMTVEGKSAEEVAQSVGMTKKAVRQAKYRVIQRLRAELGGDADAFFSREN